MADLPMLALMWDVDVFVSKCIGGLDGVAVRGLYVGGRNFFSA